MDNYNYKNKKISSSFEKDVKHQWTVVVCNKFLVLLSNGLIILFVPRLYPIIGWILLLFGKHVQLILYVASILHITCQMMIFLVWNIPLDMLRYQKHDIYRHLLLLLWLFNIICDRELFILFSINISIIFNTHNNNDMLKELKICLLNYH